MFCGSSNDFVHVSVCVSVYFESNNDLNTNDVVEWSGRGGEGKLLDFIRACHFYLWLLLFNIDREYGTIDMIARAMYLCMHMFFHLSVAHVLSYRIRFSMPIFLSISLFISIAYPKPFHSFHHRSLLPVVCVIFFSSVLFLKNIFLR